MKGLVLLVAGMLLGACANTHQAVISGDGARQASNPNEFDTRLIAVDGQYLSSANLQRAAIKPGTREILVESLQPDARSQDERPYTPRRQRLVLEVAPCTEYYLKAVHPTFYSARFTVQVAATKPLADCEAESAAVSAQAPGSTPSA